MVACGDCQCSRAFFQYKCCMTASGVAGYIAPWRPPSVPAEAARFARTAVQAAGPDGRQRAKNLLGAAGKLAGHGVALRPEPAARGRPHPTVLDARARHPTGLTGP